MSDTTEHTELVDLVGEVIYAAENKYCRNNNGWDAEQSELWLPGFKQASARAALAALEPHIQQREQAAKVELLQEWKSNAILQSRYADEVKNELDVIIWNTIAILFNRYEAAARDESTTDTEREDE